MYRIRHVLACALFAAGALLAAPARARVVTATLALAWSPLGLITDFGLADVSLGYVVFGKEIVGAGTASADVRQDSTPGTVLSAELQLARIDGPEAGLLPVDVAAVDGTPWDRIEKGPFRPDNGKRAAPSSFRGINQPGTMANLVGSFSGARPNPGSLALLGTSLIGLGFTTSRRRRAGRVHPGAVKRIGG